MIRIGFEEDEKQNVEVDEDGNIIERHGDSFDIKNKRRDVYLPQSKIDELMLDMDCAVVNDYGDGYHMSEEERAAENELYEIFKNFRVCKHSYRKLDEYVEAVREMLKCLNYIAEKNWVYSPDKFKKLWFENKIYISGLFMPKFKGRERKNIDYKYLSEFILSDKPAEYIIPKKKDELFTDEDYERAESMYFDKGELEFLLSPPTDSEIEDKRWCYDKTEDDPLDHNGLVYFQTNKEAKQLRKEIPDFMYMLKEVARSERSTNRLDEYAYMMSGGAIDHLEKNDRLYEYESESDVPEFKGDILNSKDYHKYLLELKEFEDSQTGEYSGGRFRTYEQIKNAELRMMLEDNGWNIRNLYENKEKEKRLKKLDKESKKRERIIKQRLIDIQKRREASKRQLGTDFNDEEEYRQVKRKMKKKSKKAKKIKKNLDKRMESLDKRLKMDEDAMDFVCGIHPTS